jgi:hypothetical protein
MKPRTRSIHNLYHRWGQDSKLNAYEIGVILLREKLIEYIYFNTQGQPTHYKETIKMFDIPEQVFNETILKLLRDSK